MAIAGEGDARGCGSQFFFTLGKDLDYLDGKHAVFGRIVEGEDTLRQMNEVFTDNDGKPLRDIRIRHVIVLGEYRCDTYFESVMSLTFVLRFTADDPFPDPPGLVVAPESPVPTALQLASLRVGDAEDLEEHGTEEDIAATRRARDARAQALTLEMVGDLPFADVAPPENVLFVCKLNQITKSEDLELIFSRFGTILSCEIICDPKSGDSLQYAFVEFKEREDAERAYAKMDNVLVDDRRIMVDFSQVRFSSLLSLKTHCTDFIGLCYAYSRSQNYMTRGCIKKQEDERLRTRTLHVDLLLPLRHDLTAKVEMIEKWCSIWASTTNERGNDRGRRNIIEMIAVIREVDREIEGMRVTMIEIGNIMITGVMAEGRIGEGGEVGLLIAVVVVGSFSFCHFCQFCCNSLRCAAWVTRLGDILIQLPSPSTPFSASMIQHSSFPTDLSQLASLTDSSTKSSFSPPRLLNLVSSHYKSLHPLLPFP